MEKFCENFADMEAWQKDIERADKLQIDLETCICDYCSMDGNCPFDTLQEND
jgi:hypothetical protein